MRKLSRYISETVTASILMVLVVILGFDAIADIIEQMGELEGNYTFSTALRFVVLSIPGNIFDLLPFAALVGCLAGLGSLANNSELIVVRTAGVSTGRIVWMVMRPTLVIMLVGVLNSEYIAPNTESIAQSERATALRKSENVVSREGLWHREGNQFMHFNVVQPNGVLYGVTIYAFDDQRQLLSSLMAERAIYQTDHWLLEDVVESQLFSDRVDRKTSASKIWQTDLSPELLNILVLDPMDLSIEGLWQYSNYLQGQGLNSGPYLLAFWKKVLQPLSTVSLVLVLCAFLSTYSFNAQAEQNTSRATHPEPITTPFYRQLLRPEPGNKRPADSSLLQQVMISNLTFDASPIDSGQDDDLAFNYLWMQQYQHDNRQKAGGAAVGKILRMSVKSLYDTYTGNGSSSNNNEDIGGNFSAVDYRLRLSGDKVKLGIQYEF